MTMTHRLACAMFTVFALLLGTTASAASAANAGSGPVHLTHAWIRLLPGALPAAGYAVIHNDSDHATRLIGASSGAFNSVMLHRSTSENGMQRMAMVAGMDVPAHGSAKLAPGAYHLMLTQPTRKLSAGGVIIISLHFADGSRVAAPFKLRPANAH